MPLMWYLNYLAKTSEVSEENFEKWNSRPAIQGAGKSLKSLARRRQVLR